MGGVLWFPPPLAESDLLLGCYALSTAITGVRTDS